ncbi:MAG TPA: rhodanese-like domain-containing protein [Anaerolineales bacterium]|nr:rhodanese-like domain-containing protein [Anaerolineales bacterium]
MKKTVPVLILLAVVLAACQAAAPQASYTDISADELSAMFESKDFFFVNTHIPYEGEIAQTDAFIAYDDLAAYDQGFPADRDAKIVLYCRSGRMSAIAAEELARRGYTNLYNLDGGMAAWEQAGYPLEFK